MAVIGNVERERRAIKAVMRYERKKRRNPEDVHSQKLGYDVKSRRRFIEVKGLTSERPAFAEMQDTIKKKHILGRNYWLYVVYNLREKPKIKIVPPHIVRKYLRTVTKYLINSSVINKYGRDA